MMAKKKKVLLIVLIPICLLLVYLLIHAVYAVPRSPKLELIDTQYTGKQKRATNVFFVKDKDSYFIGNNDMESYVKYYLPGYDFSMFDTDNYTYIVAVDYEIDKLSYDGMHCRLRNELAFPEIYYALIDGKKTNDGNLRIYRMKKMDKLEMHDSDPDYTNENYRKNYNAFGY